MQSSSPVRELSQDFSYAQRIGPFGSTTRRVGLGAGTYKLVFEDDEGMFYRGPDWCVRFYGEKSDSIPEYFKDGGIWIPKHLSGSRARVFEYTYGRQTPSRDSGGSRVASDQSVVNTAVSNAVSVGTPSPLQAGIGAGAGVAVASLFFAAMEKKDQVSRHIEIPVVPRLEQELFSTGGFAGPPKEPATTKHE